MFILILCIVVWEPRDDKSDLKGQTSESPRLVK